MKEDKILEAYEKMLEYINKKINEGEKIEEGKIKDFFTNTLWKILDTKNNIFVNVAVDNIFKGAADINKNQKEKYKSNEEIKKAIKNMLVKSKIPEPLLSKMIKRVELKLKG